MCYSEPHTKIGRAEVDAQQIFSNAPVNRTQMPTAGERFLVRYLSKPGHLVLDMFSGTGTASIAALKEGRSAVSVESNKLQFVCGNSRARTLFESEAMKAVVLKVINSLSIDLSTLI